MGITPVVKVARGVLLIHGQRLLIPALSAKLKSRGEAVGTARTIAANNRQKWDNCFLGSFKVSDCFQTLIFEVWRAQGERCKTHQARKQRELRVML